uniref:Glucuronokinase with putative uridyl pyrophosphorylase n=2 Tax=Callorhinchus milii TaxID=7868 RepID=A0A4W3GXF7_CALMI
GGAERICNSCGSVVETTYFNEVTGLYSHLEGIPKALLPGVGGKKILDFWWEVVNTRQLFSEVYLITNADKYKYYERWATANDFPVENIINDGTTTGETRLGAVADLELLVRSKKFSDDVLVVAGDMLCEDLNFDISEVIKFFKFKKGELAIYYEMEEGEKSETRGIVEVCPCTNRITKFYEKPSPNITQSRLASVVFYCFRAETLPTLGEYLEGHPDVDDRVLGKYLEWLINKDKAPVFGMKLPTGFQLIGNVGLSEYKKWLSHYSAKQHGSAVKSITCCSYARIGIMGNPSDGFYGKTIAMTISNFWADVTIHESKKLVLVPHPLNDPTEFGSLQDLHGISRKEGYLGGLRLLQATCKKFYQYCSQQGIALAKRNFTLKYDTNIPRQVVSPSTNNFIFNQIQDFDLQKPLRASFILNVETEELFITAGLQDRVVQVYEGLVYMDFSKELMETRGYGNYLNMDISCAPQFWLAYLGDPSDSGKIHSNVRQRWLNGDSDVVAAMKAFAELTDLAKHEEEWETNNNIYDKNYFLCLRSIYTDACLGNGNLRMVELGRKYGSAVKLPGSGGAVIGLCLDPDNLVDLKKTFQESGFVVCDVVPCDPSTSLKK